MAETYETGPDDNFSWADEPTPRITDHGFLPVAGHPDDNECTYREDGTDDTYCGQPEQDHEWSDE